MESRLRVCAPDDVVLLGDEDESVTCTRDARMVFTRRVVCSGPRHVDAGIVGMVHAHDLDASTAVCGLVSEML